MGLFGSSKKVDELLQATYLGNRTAVFGLVRDGVKTGSKSKAGITAMHIIGYLDEDRTGIMDNLLFGKADIDEPEDNYGWTPLHIAAGMGNIKVAGQLLTKGANINLRDKHGATPLDMATAQSEKKMFDFLSQHGGQEGTGTIASGPLAVPVSKVGKAIDAVAEAAKENAAKARAKAKK
jgi:ankyrin repeat protein